MATLAQPLTPPTKQAKVAKTNGKPTKSLEKLLNTYFAKPLYGKDGKIRRAAPKIIVKALKDIDSKSKSSYQIKIDELKAKHDALPLTPDGAQARQDIEKQIESIRKEQNRLYENLINISSFDFVRQLEKCNKDINQITDPELRGYLEILGDKINKDVFKTLIDQFKFPKTQSKNYSEILKNMFSNNKYKMKIFNASFTHPDMLDKQGKPILRSGKFKKDSTTEEHMQLYLKRFCKYFDWVLQEFVKGTNIDQIVITAMNNYAQEKKYTVNIQEVWTKALQHVEGTKYDKATRELIGVYHSVKSMLDELKQYPKLKEEYNIYVLKLQQFEQVKAIELRTGDSITFLQSFCQIIKALEVLNIKGFQDLIFNDFIHESGMKFKPDVRKKLRECAIAGQQIQQVEQQFETKQLKVKDKETGEFKTKQVASDMQLAANQFLKEDINVFESVETSYDTEKYNKIGCIIDIKVPKAWHVALALRILKEVKYTIAEGQAKGQNQFVFAL